MAVKTSDYTRYAILVALILFSALMFLKYEQHKRNVGPFPVNHDATFRSFD